MSRIFEYFFFEEKTFLGNKMGTIQRRVGFIVRKG